MQSIDWQTLRSWLEQRRPLVVLDVRSAADRAEWAIPGSVHVDAYNALKAGDRHVLDQLQLPDDRPVVAVCRAGRVSQIAAELLAQRGLQAYSLSGGMQAWSLAWNTAEVHLPGAGARSIQVRRTGKGCLSYIVGANGEAAVIDAALDAPIYQELARQAGWRITAVLDTHIHADHLSRSRVLAEQCQVPLYLPAQQRVQFSFTPLVDGDQLALGGTTLTALHTPGHTDESMCYLLGEQALFTGDTLFLNAVGRPDLHAKPEQARQRAAQLYASLQRLLDLPPTLLILPGHSSSPVPFDQQPISASLAEVLGQTMLLQAAEQPFIDALLARIPPTPPHYQRIIELNEAGELNEQPVELEAGANRCAIV